MHGFLHRTVSTDHPRRCGENIWLYGEKGKTMGSPPQVRGKRKRLMTYMGRTGITPAGAGKTNQQWQCKDYKEDHPRRCGENLPEVKMQERERGSPPQVRGKLPQFVILPEEVGITPAGAGKTAPTQRARRNAWDHPRRCGENRLGGFFRLPPRGSPPQVRGKLLIVVDIVVWVGITPADAGKTFKFFAALHRAWDHPRRCGENHIEYDDIANRVGSPPQMRGKHLMPFASTPEQGITPADAGKTLTECFLHVTRQDHPRRCGENSEPRQVGREVAGSPPQMRGKLALLHHAAGFGRITPADAGKTEAWLHRGCNTTDHPRRCGENLIVSITS